MEHNPYEPPLARVEEPAEAADQYFYVVSRAKFLLLMIGTLTAYSLYWFYRNWSLLNRRHKQYWPVPRAIFSVFFTHSLFEEVDGAIQKRGAIHAWSWRLWATVYVVGSIVSSLLGRLAAKDIGSPWTDLVGLLMVVPITWSLYVAQRAINVAAGDPEGASNRRITLANIAWLVLFSLVWLLTLLGIWFVMDPAAFE